MTLNPAADLVKLIRDVPLVTNFVRVGQPGEYQHLRIECWCGQKVSGRAPIVEEAHRQHLLNHRRAA